MSSIHYKFKAALEYKTLVFDGLHISVNDLKKEICEKEHIKADSFDLVLYNAYTNQPYREVIPRNSSVIVQRTPRDNAAKLPKVHDTSNSGIVNKPTSVEPAFVPHIESEQFDKMTEEERLSHVKEVSSYKYLPSNFQKKTSSILSGPPPPTYVCNRCSQPGHWYKNCPMLNTKRTTGLTMDELTDTTPDDPLAMLHPSGRFVVPIMHMKARQQKKIETATTSEGDIREIPTDLKCPLCSQLLRDAVLATCCGDSFCAECVQQRLLESSNAKCPGTNCFQSSISADKLIPNIKLRRMVENFKNAAVAGHTTTPSVSSSTPPIDNPVTNKPAAEESVPLQPIQRVRIGLSNRTAASSSAVVTALHQPVAQPQQQEPQVAPQILPATTSQSTTTYNPIIIDKSAIISVPSTSTASQQPAVPANCTPPQQIIETSVPPPPIPATQVAANLIPPVPVSTVLPVNIHQPPPGYAPILHTVQSALPDTSIAPPGTVGARTGGIMHHVSTPPVLIPPNIQPPPPGLSAPTIFPTVSAPPPVKDAWDEFLERKEKDRQRAIAIPRTRRSSRSSSYSSSASSSSQSSDSRSRSRTRSRSHSRTRSRSWSRERNLRIRRRPSRERRMYRRRGSSRSPRIAYAGNRFHRDVNNFMLYQSTGSNALPPSNYQQHRIGGSLSGFPPIPGISDSVTAYAGYSGNTEFRSARNYEDRGYRPSPRTAISDYRIAKRRSSSRDRDVERKDRYEETRHRNDDRKKPRREEGEKKHAKSERKHVKPKHKDHGEKDETKTKEMTSQKKLMRGKVEVKSDITDSEEINKEKVEREKNALEENDEELVVKESVFAAEPIKDENEEDNKAVGAIEDIDVESAEVAGMTVVEDKVEPVDLDDKIDKENKADVELGSKEKEEQLDEVCSAKEESEPIVKTDELREVFADKKTDFALVELSNRNEADSTTVGDEKERGEKKKKKKKKRKHKREEKSEKKKRHRHSTEESEGEKKHKKHKRSKEEKEKRREEKEKRREERRRRKQNKSENVEADNESIVLSEKVVVEEMSVETAANDSAEQSKAEELHQEDVETRKNEPKVAAALAVGHEKVEEVPRKPSRSRHHSSRDESRTRRKHRHSEKTEERLSEKKHEEEKRSKHDEVKEEKEKGKKLKPVEDLRKKEGLKTSNSPKNEKSREMETPTLVDKTLKSERSPHKAEKYHSARKDSKKKDDERDARAVEKVKVKELREHSSKGEATSSKLKAENTERRSEKRKSEVDRDDHKKPRQIERKDSASEKRREHGRVSERTSKDKLGNQLSSGVDSVKNDASASGVAPFLKTKEKTEEPPAVEKDVYERKFDDEEGLDARAEVLRGVDVQKDKPNITVEVKLGGEKKVTRENVFENAGPAFNARQKIKMILLSESQRFAADRAKKRGSKLIQ